MSKIVPSKKIGIPVPAALPADAQSLVVYYGPKGAAMAYNQAARIVLAIAGLTTQSVTGSSYWVFDSSALPALAEGEYDLSFTLADTTGNEGDFSPVVTIPLDRTPPIKLGTPITL